MKLKLQPARDGALKALKTTLTLAKIIIPVTMAVVALDQLNLMVVIAQWFNPLARLFGLPGEAALVLLLGFLVGIYAALGAIVLLPLSTGDITVLAVMILKWKITCFLPPRGPISRCCCLAVLLSL